jgi:hypothetical protein
VIVVIGIGIVIARATSRSFELVLARRRVSGRLRLVAFASS